MSELLWSPSPEQVADANLTRFIAFVNRERGLELKDYDQLWEWSVTEIAAFWESMWQFAGITASTPYDAVLVDPKMPGAKWFPGARLNFAENLLRYRDDRVALTFVQEGGAAAGELTYAELYNQVAQFARFLKDAGVGEGDLILEVGAGTGREG